MTSNNSNALSVLPEEAVSDKLNQSAIQSPLEPKQSIDNVLFESKRLIKSGYYKKAFNFVESFKAEGSDIPPIANIKLCRRMVICLTRICTRYLTKGEQIRVDHFLKLMNKSYDYLQTWHDLLCSYVSKTNPKFSHLRKILSEVSDMYEENLETGDIARVKLNLNANANNHTNTSYLSTAESRETKPSSFLNKLKQNPLVSKDAGRIYLEDTGMSHFEQDSRIVTEALTGQEINACFHLDEFIKYYLTTLLNWANFHKKTSKKYDAAYRFLLFAHRVAKVIDSCLDPETLQLIAKIRLALGVFYSEFGKQKEALDVFESTLNTLQIDLSLRINRNKENSNIMQVQKLKESIRLLILASMNMSVIYEQRENYARTLECLRLGAWFAGKFLPTNDEILNSINTQYNITMQRYDKYLKELGELERVVTEKTNTITAEDPKETKESDHVAKMNYHLYNKFNYEKLNASQFIVIASPSTYDKDNNPRKSEFFDDKTEFGESKNWSKLREHRTEASFARTTTIEDIEMQHTSTSLPWKRPSNVATKTNIRDKKKEKLKLDSTTEDNSRFIISRKYQTEGAFDHEKEEFQLDSDEEKEYIEKLNRNIKEKKKIHSKKNGVANKREYLDIDSFFNNVVDKKIQDKEEELKLHQPREFKKIVKDYGYFLKNETFDGVEFGFATRSLTAKARENLGDYTVETKYKPPTFKVAQRNEVKIEAQLAEARFATEKKINQRNYHLKNFFQGQAKSPQAKTVKFATSPTSGRETRVATLVTIDEQQPSTTRSVKQTFPGKHTFTGILMKHHEDLGLNGVHDVIKEREKKASKLLKKKMQQAEMTQLGLFNKSSMGRFETPKGSLTTKSRDHHREVNPEQMSKYAETTKNTIQLWMEEIEKKVEDDEHIKKRIEENKPLVQTQKSAEKFLKVPEDLAKSTEKISIKAQSTKKAFDFSSLVKNSYLLNKKTVTIKAP